MHDLPSYLYFTTISDAAAYQLGFDFASIGEFDLDKDTAMRDRILTGFGVEPRRLSYGARLAHELVRLSPPLLWNLNSGIVGYTREAQVPALCEMLQIPLVGPGAWTAFVTQDKSMACSWVAQSGL